MGVGQSTTGEMTKKSTRKVLGHSLVLSLFHSHRTAHSFACSALLPPLRSFARSLIHSLTRSLLLVRSLTHLQAHSVARSLICMLTQLHPHPFARSLIHLLICLLTNSFACLLAVSVARSFNRVLTLCSLTHCLLTRF